MCVCVSVCIVEEAMTVLDALQTDTHPLRIMQGYFLVNTVGLYHSYILIAH